MTALEEDVAVREIKFRAATQIAEIHDETVRTIGGLVRSGAASLAEFQAAKIKQLRADGRAKIAHVRYEAAKARLACGTGS